MSETIFWNIIAETLDAGADQDRQLAALRASLEQRPIADVLAFEAGFDAVMTRSYSWDLWGAGYVIHGGLSDDSFEYFRCWLVSKGRIFFEAAERDPDQLAVMITEDPGDYLEFEALAYVAREVWGARTGNDSGDMPGAAGMCYPSREPAGVEFGDEEVELAERYPRLWARFGHAPLG